MVRGRRIKLRYAHAGGQNPPVIVVHGNQIDQVPSNYVRYLEKIYVQALELKGTPVRIEFKGSDNPYSGKGSKVGGKAESQQAAKKRRLQKTKESRNKDTKTKTNRNRSR